MLEAAHAWDGVRGLAVLAIPSWRPNAWAALSRYARALAESEGEREAPGWDCGICLAPEKPARLKAAADLAAVSLERLTLPPPLGATPGAW
jgi:hypothetical protein